MARKTNKQLAEEQFTTPRQISKSRRRGWFRTKDGMKVQYKAPEAIHITPKKKKPSTNISKSSN